MNFEGKAKWFWSKTSYIELIALYVHQKNSNHFRLHSRAIMALDHSKLGLENKFLKKKSGRIFCFRQVYFTKSCQQIWGVWSNLLYFLYITSEVKQYYEVLYLSYRPWTECSISQFFKANCTQSIFRTINRGLLAKPFKNFQNHLCGQPILIFDKFIVRAVVECLNGHK